MVLEFYKNAFFHYHKKFFHNYIIFFLHHHLYKSRAVKLDILLPIHIFDLLQVYIFIIMKESTLESEINLLPYYLLKI